MVNNQPSIKSFSETNFITSKAVVVEIITETALSLATYLHPTKEQISKAADIIISEYKYFCYDDIRLCMLNGLKGLYGELLRFDVNIICSWLTKYKEEKRIIASRPQPEKKEPQKEIIKEDGFTYDKEGKRTYSFHELPIEEQQRLYALNPHLWDKPKGVIKKETDYKWPNPSGLFEVSCIEVFKEKWEEQGEPLTDKKGKPLMKYKGTSYIPNDWLIYCYQLQDENENKLK